MRKLKSKNDIKTNTHSYINNMSVQLESSVQPKYTKMSIVQDADTVKLPDVPDKRKKSPRGPRKSKKEPVVPLSAESEFVESTRAMIEKITETEHEHDIKAETKPDGVLGHLGDYEEEPFTMIQSYFRGQHLERLVRHQIES